SASHLATRPFSRRRLARFRQRGQSDPWLALIPRPSLSRKLALRTPEFIHLRWTPVPFARRIPPSRMKRPWPVTVFGILFVLAGSVGFGYHLAHRPFERDVILISAIRLLAVLGGAFLLLGHNLAPWLLLAWLAFHI